MPIRDPAPVRAALSMLSLPIEHLWVDYMGIGGDLELRDLADFVAGRSALSEREYDRLAQAINEKFMDRDENHPLAYAEDIQLGPQR
jgi:hypothetical protein